MSKISITFDIEPDLHSPTHKGVIEGISKIIPLLERHKVKATFFTTARVIEKFPFIFKALKKQGHEIAIHGYDHKRFDDLSIDEKEFQIKKSVEIFRKILNQNPKGFRAPQHSIDKPTLKILKNNNFSYDSSLTPFNIIQPLFFPKKLKHELKSFFSKRQKYNIYKNLYEIPVSSLLIPFVSLPLRIFPWQILKIYLWFLQGTNNTLVFYAHSWDFIKLPKSRIDKMFSHEKLIKNLEKMLEYLSRRNKFVTMENL